MYDIGIIGLAVMGENLARNFANHGYSVLGYDRSIERMTTLKEDWAGVDHLGLAASPERLVAELKTPRTILIMVPAGAPVDDVLSGLLPHLDKGDIIIDGGNSHYQETERRVNELALHGIRFIGSGVSGGEYGALHGPSLMPGGDSSAWDHVRPMFEAIAAKTEDGDICTTWIGPAGSGHYVKMVHNGIEYGDIQLITEVYGLMRSVLGMEPDAIADVFEHWNKGPLNSYLIDITSRILRKRDTDGTPLIDRILDTAGQKGTGRWTAIQALEEGVPLSLINEAVGARLLSARKDERRLAASIYPDRPTPKDIDKDSFLTDLELALYVAKRISYAQGFDLMKTASDRNDWQLDLGAIALIWREGCIIKSAFLSDIKRAYDRNPSLSNLLMDKDFQTALKQGVPALRRVVSQAVQAAYPIPALSAGLQFFEGYTSERLPANLLQAMRDYFGAHTYERTDHPRGMFFHTDWQDD
jgi:6-phosphogluconate dehydrogenase